MAPVVYGDTVVCGHAEENVEGTTMGGLVAIDGSSTVFPITEAVGEEFQGLHKGVRVTVEVEGRCELSADLHVALYRIAQEALNNVVKHAKASQVAVSLRCTPSPPSPSLREGEEAGVKVELLISDDGQGFNPDDIPPERMGLGIMRERAEAVGAQVEIVSRTGRGTQVTVVWPAPASVRAGVGCR